MMHFTAKILTLVVGKNSLSSQLDVLDSLTVLAFAQTTHALEATILADTNRDGKVDSDDAKGKSTWTDKRGALFLPNIGDTNQRCSKKYANVKWEDYESLNDDELEACNDASGNVQRNPKYLAPLRTAPSKELSSNAHGSIYVSSKASADKVRIFVKDGDDWAFVSSNHTFTADELKDGLELGIDSRDIRRPQWDGRATVHFSIIDGDDEATDSVVLRVAPLLSHHHLQEASRVFALTNYPGSEYNYPAQEQFLVDLRNSTDQAGIEEGLYEFTVLADIWLQDMFEPGYASIPGPDGPVVLRVMIRSAQTDRFPGRQVFTQLRSDSVGAVQFLRKGNTLDSMGNLEAIPPYTHNEESYPAGRIIMGAWGEQEPLIMPLLRAQETQDPLILDTIWLAVGHVDEFIQFLPANNERGWVIMVSDPLAGLGLLKKASKDGHGSKRAFSRPHFDYDYNFCVPDLSVDEQLAQEDFEAANEDAARHIEGNIDILKNATGVTDEEIFRVPATFYYFENPIHAVCEDANSTSSAASQKATKPKMLNQIEAISPKNLERRQEQPTPGGELIAHHPGTINGVVLSDSFYLSPNPWGPVIDGKDIIAEGVRDAYAKANYEVTFQDDWITHHIYGGEIHCGTNTWRDADAPWW